VNAGEGDMLGALPLKWGTKVPFDNSITGNFTVYEDRFKQFIAAIRPHRKCKMLFYNICYYV